MTIWDACAVFAAGVGAGTINAVVGSGTLLTFPVLLAVGLPPVTANVSNTLGLVPGSVSAVIGYRRELAGLRAPLVRLGPASLIGGLVGALLLLTLPAGIFATVVPVFIAAALVLVVLQPRIARAVAARRGNAAQQKTSWVLVAGVFATGVYGGYFGAAQGVLLIGLLGTLLHEDLQRINAVKNVLALLVNGVAAVVFLFVAHFDWSAVLLIAAGSVIGGQAGARLGRRLSSTVLRVVIVAVGLVAIGQLLT
ncbi:sulfite exporter TauE/SafE family protein [Streptantibioticus rubrisoli]|uniref:Probable membrane transporter protein n=1 Tax=Streptantibioticus rubrisoli TaxID=1387313 RepID=A0ABT1P718_9ACTN|nr:sulfite exporter TauE/SafE family protein [Streptantibioticus rubrisoli]MCQ4041171.1 sulfite exporter TauE/SafE family protein [Streptantibioticus rubrisoli]